MKTRVRHYRRLTLLSLTLPAVALPLSAVAGGDPLCPGYALPSPDASLSTTVDTDAPIDATADSVYSEGGHVTLDGSTVIEYQGREIRADNADYNAATGEVTVEGDLTYTMDGFELKSNDATVNLDDKTLRSGASSYLMTMDGQIAQGRASRLVRDEKERIKLWDATYSSCPPGREDWNITASKIRLDQREGVGTAKNITLRFKDVPILYAPVFSFAIDDKRKSGFLAPSFRQADNTGFEILLPWYWNIAPNLDATLTPRFMTMWGTQLQTELRYLNRIGTWQLNSEYLYKSDYEDSRRFTRFRHNGSLSENWSTLIDASFVSDKDYFTDFGDSLDIASITHLDRRAELRYQNINNDFLIRIQRYQTVDEDIDAEDRPYMRLPQISWDTSLPQGGSDLHVGMESELVYFDRDDSVTGARLDLNPAISLPVNRDAWFLTPTAGLHYTRYDLNNVEEADSGVETDATFDRTLPYFSLDGGLFFDRPLGNSGSVQTLEPRIFYLRVPYEDQSDIPVFDSGELDFNFSQLFRENRFSGADRVADANQISTAITTRWIDGPSGREQLRASLGQIVYFDDRRVMLESTDSTETRGSSDIVGEISAELKNNWSVRTGIQWNPYSSTTERSSMQLSYRPDNGGLFNMAHRRLEGETELIDFSAYWPVNDRWKLGGRWNYSLDSDTSIETTLGVEYESCCWAFRFAARRYISDNGLDHDTNFFLELILKGLAPVGDNIGELLESGVLGYLDEYR
ncbi:LPS-assembly protein LptD [Granulosicoccaceae sp. 1_MG-2023]|nr:LPS-assembly protein LptD [Granulosicoccaceae sp. 1_MG-2023]